METAVKIAGAIAEKFGSAKPFPSFPNFTEPVLSPALKLENIPTYAPFENPFENVSKSSDVKTSVVPTNRPVNGTARDFPVVDIKILTIKRVYEYFSKLAEEYGEYTGGRVNVTIEEVENLNDLADEIKSSSGEIDGYILNPTSVGYFNITDYFLTLDDLISNSTTINWGDIFYAYREYVNVFGSETLLVPFDGDVMSMYYRSDILKYFNLTVPRTWEEYNNVAKSVHGQEYNGKTLIGSCVGRKMGWIGYFWSNLILSSMTQYQGTSTGFLFNPLNMEPLTGEALEKTIEYLEGQVKYGSPDEFDFCDDDSQTPNTCVNLKWMQEGSCVLTYDLDHTFKHQNGTVVEGVLGVAPTPGSTEVYDRELKKLVACTEEICGKYGYYDNDNGWINLAPYAAFGGWSGALSKNNSALETQETFNFFSYLSNPPESLDAELDPFRRSMLDLNAYVELGFPSDETQQYFSTVSTSLESENTVIDIRFLQSREIISLLDKEIAIYLERFSNGDGSANRTNLVDSITNQFNEIIASYDADHINDVDILIDYQDSLSFASTSGSVEETIDTSKSNENRFITVVIPIVFFLVVLFFSYYYLHNKYK